MSHEILYGKHAVLAAINNKKRKKFALYTSHKQLTSQEFNFPVYYKNNNELNKLTEDTCVHNGYVLKTSPLEIEHLTKYNIADLNNKILILDQINDPQNVGSIIRNAAAFQFNDIIITEYNSSKNFSTIAKTSAGQLENINLLNSTNINNLIKLLKQNNYWIIGLSGYASINIKQLPQYEKFALILGSESKGIRPLIQKNCDILAKIPMNPNVESLNVSSAGAICMHHFSNL
jgi:23S rRNA (guanosine2251-2'-O)-methyltransferase